MKLYDAVQGGGNYLEFEIDLEELIVSLSGTVPEQENPENTSTPCPPTKLSSRGLEAAL